MSQFNLSSSSSKTKIIILSSVAQLSCLSRTCWNDAGSNGCITEVASWGETGTTDLSHGFANSRDLKKWQKFPQELLT